MFIRKVKKLICVLSVSTLLIGTYALPSFATDSLIQPMQGIQNTIPKLTDQQKKDLVDSVNKNGKFAKKYGKIDISKATNADLEDYGIPDRPTDPQALKQWNDEFSNVKEVIKPEFEVGDFTCGWPNNTSNTNIWSGCANGDQSLNPNGFNSVGYQNVLGSFNVPTISSSISPSAVSMWVGLGGSSDLIQDGVEASYCNRTDPNIPLPLGFHYQAFWEEAPRITMVYKDLTINAGDKINVGTALSNDIQGTWMVFRITNSTTGQTTGDFKQLAGGTKENDSALWITEAPQYKNLLSQILIYPLANYGTVNWLGSYAYGSIGGANQIQCCAIPNHYAGMPICRGINMVKSVLESQVSNPTSYNTFTTTWKAP